MNALVACGRCGSPLDSIRAQCSTCPPPPKPSCGRCGLSLDDKRAANCSHPHCPREAWEQWR